MAKGTFLKDILEHKQKVNGDKREFFAQIKAKLDQSEYRRYRLFNKQISQAGRISLIAEIKKASPSKGLIRKDFDLLNIARIYVENKADAISVLTEEKYFLGKPVYVKQVADAFKVPVLTKDFIIEEGQIYEARLNGASAVLLIVAILNDKVLKDLVKVSARLDLDALVEVHDEEELKRAVECGAEIIGVNNRDLRTFEVDMAVAEKLIPRVPKNIVKVAESGIKSHAEVQRLKELGANAVLIGETFMGSQNIGTKVKEVMGNLETQ